MTKAVHIAVVAVVCALILPAAAGAAPGDLDPTFGNGGFVTTDFGGRGDAALGVAVQPDGKVIVAGNSSARDVFNVDFALARYNSDGTLDSSFGNGGTVLSDLGSNIDAASDVLLQPDGKIVAAGTSNRQFGVARYTSAGALDPSFGSGGIVRTGFGGGFDQAWGVARQADGKLVVVGTGGPNADILVARYNADGSLDDSFGSSGKVITDLGSFDQALEAVIANDGRITVGGRSGGDFALARYLPDGSLDPSFGSGGVVTTDFGDNDPAFAIAADPSGRIVAAGQSGSDFALARYNGDGSLDTGFGNGGKVTTDFSGGSSEAANGLVISATGTITAAGFTSAAAGSTAFALARYDTSGHLDASFGTGGKATATLGNPLNTGLGVALQPDGNLVVVGVTGEFGTGVTDFGVARFLGSVTPLKVTVDVRPDSADNVVPLNSNGVLPVAILTTSTFDAATVDSRSVCFGDADTPAERSCTARQPDGHREDVNGDGRPDLLFQYEIAKTGIDPGDTEACLTGKTLSGSAIKGCDGIRTR
jgi:uncharacterized delta-60 repeat protein